MISKTKAILLLILVMPCISLFSFSEKQAVRRLTIDHKYEELCENIYDVLGSKKTKEKQLVNKFILTYARLGHISMLYLFLRSLHYKGKEKSTEEVLEVYLISLILLLRVSIDLEVCKSFGWKSLVTWDNKYAVFSNYIFKSWCRYSTLDLFKRKLVYWFKSYFVSTSEKFPSILEEAAKRVEKMFLDKDCPPPVSVKCSYAKLVSCTNRICFGSLSLDQIRACLKVAEKVKKERASQLKKHVKNWSDQSWKKLFLDIDNEGNYINSRFFEKKNDDSSNRYINLWKDDKGSSIVSN